VAHWGIRAGAKPKGATWGRSLLSPRGLAYSQMMYLKVRALASFCSLVWLNSIAPKILTRHSKFV
jgi:hypothetical protein